MDASVVKIVIAGPVGAGKTTLIGTVSEVTVLDTDVVASEDIGKPTTTVALDHGVVTLGDTRLHLFGTPGQERFDFVWELLAEGALGVVVLLRADKPEQLPKARYIRDFIASRTGARVVVAPTHLDMPQRWSVEEIAAFMRVPLPDVVATDPRTRDGALRPLRRIVEKILQESAARKEG